MPQTAATSATRAALPLRLAAAPAVIVNVGALAANRAGVGTAAYATADADVARATEALADDLKDGGVRVNAVLPTILDTPVNRADRPDADTSRRVSGARHGTPPASAPARYSAAHKPITREPDMPNSRTFDHRFNGRFRIEIEGVTQAAFSACDGLEARIDVVEFNDGDDASVHKRPGRTRYANIVLRRGTTAGTELWTWFKKVLDGKLERKAGSVIVCDDAGGELFRYNFFEAWPCRWKSLELDADRPGTLVEELEMAVEKVERG